MRNISFIYTLPQMYAETKDVTRRDGWRFLTGGEVLMAVEKGMGLKKGEKIKRIYPIQVVTAMPEPLTRLLKNDKYAFDEVVREGFPHLTPKEFVEFFCDSHKCKPDKIVTRIHFRRAQ